MHRIALDFDAPIPAPLVDDVLDKLAYASQHIRHCALAHDRRQLWLDVDHAEQADDAATAARETVAAIVRGYRDVEPEMIWRNKVTPRHSAPIWEELVRARLVHEEAPGCVSLLGDACRIAAALDRIIATLAAKTFAAVPHQYPTLLPIDVMERCDYFASFPHHVTFAPHVIEDVAAIQRVSDAPAAERTGAIQHALAVPRQALSPSVCFHTYAAFADGILDRPTAVTAVNRCYRWESKNLATCERLWDFTMREIVFLGDAEWVEAQRRRAIEAIGKLAADLALCAWIESASDPFFVGRFAAKRYFQLLRRAKYELRLALPYSGGSLSAASFNIHEDFFGRAFAIRDPRGDTIATACFGAGIERWVWALFAQHGPAIADWPAAVTQRLQL